MSSTNAAEVPEYEYLVILRVRDEADPVLQGAYRDVEVAELVMARTSLHAREVALATRNIPSSWYVHEVIH